MCFALVAVACVTTPAAYAIKLSQLLSHSNNYWAPTGGCVIASEWPLFLVARARTPRTARDAVAINKARKSKGLHSYTQHSISTAQSTNSRASIRPLEKYTTHIYALIIVVRRDRCFTRQGRISRMGPKGIIFITTTHSHSHSLHTPLWLI